MNGHLTGYVLGSAMGHPTFTLFSSEHTSTSEYDHYTVPRSRSTFHWSGRGSQLLAGGGDGYPYHPFSLRLSPRLPRPLPPSTHYTDRAPCRLFDFDLPSLGALIRNLRRARGAQICSPPPLFLSRLSFNSVLVCTKKQH